MSRPLVIAHRGAAGYEFENSLAAFRAALAQGADAVELDIHATADGALVVHHGETVGDHHVPHCSLREIREHQLPNGEPIPTLEEALAVILPKMMVFVEIKSLAQRWDEKLFATIDGSPAPPRVAVHAFDHRVIRRLGTERPLLRRGVLSSSYPVNPVRCLEDSDARTLWQHWHHVDEPLVAGVHGAGMSVYAWTVDDPETMKRLCALGVDGICTNLPDVGRHAVDSLPW